METTYRGDPLTPQLSSESPIVEVETDREFIYVGDPMCSWCHGFAPVVSEIASSFKIPVRVKVGGLRAFESAEPLDANLRSFLSQEWTKIARVTGQPFSTTSLNRDGWIYDTGPADQAVVAARTIDEERALDFFAKVQHAFYADGLDVTDRKVLVDLAVEFGFERDEFAETFDASREETLLDFAETRSWGVMGYPTLLFRDGEELVRVTAGYVPFDTLQPQLESWMEARYGEETTAGMMCGPDEMC